MVYELEHLERAARLAAVRGGAAEDMGIERLALDYRKVPLSGDAVAYCDIPYKNTDCKDYRGFNHEEFYAWALRQTIPVYISEYAMPDDFICIHAMPKRQLSGSNGAGALVKEGLWVPRKVAKELKSRCTYQISLFD